MGCCNASLFAAAVTDLSHLRLPPAAARPAVSWRLSWRLGPGHAARSGAHFSQPARRCPALAPLACAPPSLSSPLPGRLPPDSIVMHPTPDPTVTHMWWTVGRERRGTCTAWPQTGRLPAGASLVLLRAAGCLPLLSSAKRRFAKRCAPCSAIPPQSPPSVCVGPGRSAQAGGCGLPDPAISCPSGPSRAFSFPS